MISDLREEMRATIFKSEILNAMLPRTILFAIIIFLWHIIEPYGIQLQPHVWFGIFSFFVVILFWNANKRTISIMEKIDDVIDGRMNATELLEKFEGGDFSLGGSLFDQITDDELELLLSMGVGENEYAKDIDWKGGGVYKTRGKDSLGPAKGKGQDTFNEEIKRIDAMTIRPEFDELEGPLTKTEKLVEEANKIAAEKANEGWNLAESNDPELIEEGVEKLGDLVATGYFKGPKNNESMIFIQYEAIKRGRGAAKLGITVDMKAVLVAGGHGSRLLPFTRYTHKTLLPLHRRPVIDYALATIRKTGIKDITIIGNQFIGQIAQHVGTGLPGENIHYVIEEEPKGVHHALNLARPHVEGSRILVYFSDNIVTYEMNEDVEYWKNADEPPGCLLLGRTVPDPERFGVAVFDDENRIIDIIEKPENPPSAVAIGGIYLYDEDFWNVMDEEVSKRGSSFSISDLNRRYVYDSKVILRNIDEYRWFDCGTPDALLEASNLAREGILSPGPCNIREGEPDPRLN